MERVTNRSQEFRDLGESALALGHMDLTARATGIEFSPELGEVFDFRAGKIVRIRDFLTHTEADHARLRGSTVGCGSARKRSTLKNAAGRRR